MLAVDLLYYLPSITPSLWTAAAHMCSSPMFDRSVVVRLVRVLVARCRNNREDPSPAMQFLIGLLSHPICEIKSNEDVEFLKVLARTLAQLAGKLRLVNFL